MTGSEKSIGVFSPRRGLAAPVGLLLILFSLTMVSTIAYNYAVRQIDNRREDLKLVAAEEKNLDLEEAVSSVAWSPGGSRAFAFSDYGGQLRVEPSANSLQVNLTMDGTTYAVFDSNTGRFVYELPSTIVGRLGRWLRGDQRAIVNQSTSYQALMRVETGTEYQELVSQYRPLVSSSVGGLSAGRRINNIRIYIVNLNASEALTSGGEFHIKVTCDNVTTQVHTYNLSESITSMEITSDLDGTSGSVVVPITVGASGSHVRVEVVVSNVKIEGVSI
ncbi:MAG: hypothetical protein JSV18_08435 [Candidatus Bathyarchaeota archaeon]|nr:MAG: hypothetical protein JSV18_08435 [Candidatus Bathyarchaeota archaeon]